MPLALNPFARRSAAALSALLGALLLAACSAREGEGDAGGAPPPAEKTAPSARAPATQGPATSGAAPSGATSPIGVTVGGDGSSITLNTLSVAEIDGANLPGELACSFAAPGSSPMLIARGDAASTDAAWGVVKVGAYVERIAAPGGFDALLKGVTFSGAGKTIRIDLTGPPAGGGESPPAPATLTYDRADGARLTLAGRWSCGP